MHVLFPPLEERLHGLALHLFYFFCFVVLQALKKKSVIEINLKKILIIEREGLKVKLTGSILAWKVPCQHKPPMPTKWSWWSLGTPMVSYGKASVDCVSTSVLSCSVFGSWFLIQHLSHNPPWYITSMFIRWHQQFEVESLFNDIFLNVSHHWSSVHAQYYIMGVWKRAGEFFHLN